MAGGADMIQEPGVNKRSGKADSIGYTAAVIGDKQVSPFHKRLKGLFNRRCALLIW